jgi:hypothetical protein
MEFPCTITKGEFRYQVDSQAALDFHLGQGWSLEKAVDYTGLTADQVEAWGRAIDTALTGMAAEIESIRATLSALPAAPTPEEINLMVQGIIADLKPVSAAEPEPAEVPPDAKN